MFACKHVLFFVTQIYSLLFCHADFADDADLFFFTQSFLRRCRRSFLNFRLVCPTRPGLGASAPLPFPSAGDRWFRACGANIASVLYLSVRRSGGFQIRRDAWRGCALDYYSVIALPSLLRTVQLLPIFQLAGSPLVTNAS